jgi:hypothetical protein
MATSRRVKVGSRGGSRGDRFSTTTSTSLPSAPPAAGVQGQHRDQDRQRGHNASRWPRRRTTARPRAQGRFVRGGGGAVDANRTRHGLTPRLPSGRAAPLLARRARGPPRPRAQGFEPAPGGVLLLIWASSSRARGASPSPRAASIWRARASSAKSPVGRQGSVGGEGGGRPLGRRRRRSSRFRASTPPGGRSGPREAVNDAPERRDGERVPRGRTARCPPWPCPGPPRRTRARLRSRPAARSPHGLAGTRPRRQSSYHSAGATAGVAGGASSGANEPGRLDARRRLDRAQTGHHLGPATRRARVVRSPSARGRAVGGGPYPGPRLPSARGRVSTEGVGFAARRTPRRRPPRREPRPPEVGRRPTPAGPG